MLVIVVALIIFSRDDAVEWPQITDIRNLTSRVGPEYAGSLSPNADFLAFGNTEFGTMDLYVRPREGAVEAERITTDAGDELLPRWSRDGRWLAYVGGNGDDCHIYRIRPDGGPASSLVDTGLPYLQAFWDAMNALGASPWSQGDRSLIYSKHLGTGAVAIFELDMESRQEKQLTYPEEGVRDLSASWSFDGDKIVFARAQGGVSSLWMMPGPGEEARRIKLEREGVELEGLDDGEPSFLPGDEFVVFSSSYSGMYNLWVVHLETGETRPLTVGGDGHQNPSVTKDGLITFTEFSHQTDLYVLSMESKQSTQLTNYTKDNFAARFSPTEPRIAYHSTRDGDPEIFIRSADPEIKDERQLTDHDAVDVLPAWSPDGKEIAFLSKRYGPTNLLIAPADDSAPPIRVSPRDIDIPTLVWGVSLSIHWTPDGRSIGFVVPGEGPGLRMIDRDGENDRLVMSGVWRFAWYMDRSRILYTGMGADGMELRARNLETSIERTLHRGPHTEMIVSPKGDAVALVKSASHFNQQLYILQLEPPTSPGGLPKAKGGITPLTDGRGRWHVHNGGFSPDGKLLVYTQDTDSGDVFLIERGK
ncbi:MAG: hypothetical protein ACYTG5_21555 [Planctomycetota bacterium]